MCASSGGSGEDIMYASLAQFESFSDVGHREREVSHGDVGLCDALEFLFDFPLVKCRDTDDLEASSWESVMWHGGEKKVTAGR